MGLNPIATSVNVLVAFYSLPTQMPDGREKGLALATVLKLQLIVVGKERR